MIQWKEISDIKGFEPFKSYFVSNTGLIASEKRNGQRVILKQQPREGRRSVYKIVFLYPKKNATRTTTSPFSGGTVSFVMPVTKSKKSCLSVHRLVALAFKYNPDHYTLQVDHIDGDSFNNVESNLQWLTNKQNTKKAYLCKKYIRPPIRNTAP